MSPLEIARATLPTFRGKSIEWHVTTDGYPSGEGGPGYAWLSIEVRPSLGADRQPVVVVVEASSLDKATGDLITASQWLLPESWTDDLATAIRDVVREVSGG